MANPHDTAEAAPAANNAPELGETMDMGLVADTLTEDQRRTTLRGGRNAGGGEPASITDEQPGRYTVGRRRDGSQLPPEDAELGRGGIGRVVLALDEHLGREVAVKELLPARSGASTGLATDPRHSVQTARFLREARVTGQLEHPNIVPVYELGRRGDGTLYYTMKVVRGRSLSAALKEARRLPERLAVLNHYADLCDAIAFAHSHDVVHRDIKPDNVMVGEFGETMVLDWGLAKKRDASAGRDDAEPAPTEPVGPGATPAREEWSQSGGEGVRERLGVHTADDLAKTADGAVLGTPLYMSPEQAQGQLHRVDERSDVWSLGAVLYELLTGSPPFRGADAVALLVQIIDAPLVPVRERCPEAPPELAAIAEKALQKDPNRRYPDARALAEEVRAWLTGGRVGAYQYRAWELAKRFAARHKVALSVAMVALALLIGMGVVSYVNIVGERNKAIAAEQDARAALARAEVAERDARLAEERERRGREGAESLVAYMLGDLRERLEPVGQIALLDGVVGSVQRYYADQAQAGPAAESAPRSQRMRANALQLLGDIHAARGDLDDAQRAYQSAMSQRDEASRAGGADPILLERERADGAARLADLAASRGDLAGARDGHEGALRARQAVMGRAPDDVEVRFEVSESHAALAHVLRLLGDLPGAEANLEAAIALRQMLVEGAPSGAPLDAARWRDELTGAWLELGHIRFDRGALDAAGALYEQALDAQLRAVAANPGALEYERKLASVHDALGDVALARGDRETARQRYERGVAVMRKLVAADPANRRWQRDLVVGENRVGDVLVEGGERHDALGHYQAALEAMRDLSAHDPGNAGWRRDLAVGHNRVGDVQRAVGEHEAALASYESALAITESLVALDEANLRWRHDLALTLMKRAAAAAAVGRADRQMADLARAQTLLEALVAHDGAEPAWSADLAAVQATLSGAGDAPEGPQRQRPATMRAPRPGGAAPPGDRRQRQEKPPARSAPSPPPTFPF